MKPYEAQIKKCLRIIYGQEKMEPVWDKIHRHLDSFENRNPHLQFNPVHPNERLTHKDVFLITYGDQFASQKEAKLKNLKEFLDKHLLESISGVHILPFYPYSSDDGFSVIDYRTVDPSLGDWGDIESLGKNYRLMFDAVINHISRESDWFQGYLRNEQPFNKYFIEVDPQEDTSMVVRPRALPLLQQVEVDGETKHLWATFGADQIDLNYANPEVLISVLQVLLNYVERGAVVIRLDAIAYLWKKVGTPSIHLPETHQVIKLFRAALNWVAPNVVLITETNVPHKENVSYFGNKYSEDDRYDEAQMVYQFPLPPLIIHTIVSGKSKALVNWISNVNPPSKSTTFFNFIASHDGIGLMPAEGILSDEEISTLVDQTVAHGGRVSHKTNQDGSHSPYELNITLFDMLNDPNNHDDELDINRFVVSQAIMLSLQGVPGIYVHSLFGSRNCHECEAKTGRTRSINREKFIMGEMKKILSDPAARTTRIFNAIQKLIKKRIENAAFHPNAEQKIIDVDPKLFTVLRTSTDRNESMLCIHNISSKRVGYRDLLQDQGFLKGIDILTNTSVDMVRGNLPLILNPYQVKWIKFSKD